MTAYVYFDVRRITDPEAAAAYRRQVFATVEAFGGRYLILGGEVTPLEGGNAPATPVLIAFPDRRTALDWHGSDLYAPLLAQRQAAMVADAVLLDGFDHVPATAAAASG